MLTTLEPESEYSAFNLNLVSELAPLLLGLKWYSVPAVSALEVTIGGILYPCIPFNGWYADTEVVRDLIDEDR